MGSRVITNNFTKEIQVDNRNENMIIVIGDQQFRSKLARGREEEEVKKIEFLIWEINKTQGFIGPWLVSCWGNGCPLALLMTYKMA